MTSVPHLDTLSWGGSKFRCPIELNDAQWIGGRVLEQHLNVCLDGSAYVLIRVV